VHRRADWRDDNADSRASRIYERGFITYSNQAKEEMLGVPRSVLEQQGAVSSDVAILMAKGAQQVAQTDYALAVTGIAGPDGGSVYKPVGLVFIALAGREGLQICSENHFGPIGRDAIRALTVYESLRLLKQATD
jgi:nicotinamide-nucleotide amidase